jgi:hypothetical protein
MLELVEISEMLDLKPKHLFHNNMHNLNTRSIRFTIELNVYLVISLLLSGTLEEWRGMNCGVKK